MTTFRPPSTCTTATPQIYQIFTGREYRFEQGPLFTSGSNCFPGGYDAAPNGYYSPGFCPHGYTAACTRKDSQKTTLPVETALICCPTALRYICDGATGQTPLGCTTSWTGAVAIIGVTVMTNGVVSGPATVSESNGGIAAHSIQVRFRDGDIPVTKAGVISQPSITPEPKTGSRTISLPAQSASDTATSPASTGGVSTATAVGIGVGSAVGALLIAGSIFLCVYLRWRKMKKGRRVPPPRPLSMDPTHASIYTNGFASAFQLSEDITKSSAHSLRGDIPNPMLPERGRPVTIATTRTSRMIRTEELEDTVYLHPKAAELEYNPRAAELDGSSFSERSSRSVSPRTVDSRRRNNLANRQLTPGSAASSSSWTVMRKDAVVATPWL